MRKRRQKIHMDRLQIELLAGETETLVIFSICFGNAFLEARICMYNEISPVMWQK